MWVCVSVLSGSVAFGVEGGSWLGTLAFHLLGWAPWIPLTVLVARFAPSLPLESDRWPRSVLVWILGSLVWVTVYSAYIIGVGTVVNDKSASAVFVDRLDFWVFFDWGFYWIPVVVVYAVQYQTRAAADRMRAEAMETRAKEAEYQWRVQQLRPHFLFNALNCLSALVRVGARTEALDAIERLSRILRYTLEADGRSTVPLAEEMVVIDAYLSLQRLRMEDRLEVSIDVADDALHAEIPPMLLQPLIENAIHYGMDPATQRVHVSLSVQAREGALEVIVENNLPDPSAPSGSGVGLSSIRARLAALYDDPTGLTLTRDNGRAVVRVCVPSTLSGASTSRR